MKRFDKVTRVLRDLAMVWVGGCVVLGTMAILQYPLRGRLHLDEVLLWPYYIVQALLSIA